MQLFKRNCKVPFKQQMTDSDCGPACLAMVLAFFGRQTSVYATRVACEKFGPPQSTKSIVQAAREAGLEANLVAADIDMLNELPRPAILYWGFTHFVVLEHISEDGTFRICDPEFGRKSLKLDEFGRYYTGVAIRISVGPNFQKRKGEKNVAFRTFARQVMRTAGLGRALTAIIVAALLIQGISLLAPLLTVYVVDVVLPAGSRPLHWALLPLVVLAGLSLATLSYLRAHVIVALQQSIDGALIGGFLEHILRLPANFFLAKSVGDIQNRMNSSTVIRDAMSSYTITGFLDIVLGVSYLIVLAFMAPGFAILTIAFASVQLLVYLANLEALRNGFAAELKTQSVYQSYVYEVLNGILTIKSSSAEGSIRGTWTTKLRNYLVASKARSMIDGRTSATIAAIRLISPALLFWYSVLLYFDGAMSLGSVLAVNTVASMALLPLTSLVSSIRHMQLVHSHAERMGDVWMHEQERSGDRPSSCLSDPGTLSFRSVSFRYKGARAPSLEDVSLEIPLGKRSGIVGPSGSGKSTLAALVLALHQPDSGRVLLGGVDLAEYDLESFRGQIGYVSQETFLFNASIRANVALGLEDVDLNRVNWALTVAGLADDVAHIPMGVDAKVGPSGSALSGGQRQRVAIARAIVRRPKLLILDEATSSLDSATEHRVAEALRDIQCTQIVISHRLSTIRDCDVIHVIEDGRRAASGSHEQLLQSSSFYRTCFEAQSGNSTTFDRHLSNVV